MSDAIVSLIRTYVATWVGLAAAWLAGLGVDLEVDMATLVLAGLGVSVYYAAARALEERWPWLGVLLGSAGSPTYPQVIKGQVER